MASHSQSQQNLPNNSYTISNTHNSINPNTMNMMQQQNHGFPFNNSMSGQKTVHHLQSDGGGGGGGEPSRKKRGRPRKCIGMGNSSSETPTAKRLRGRPPGSVKKQLNSLGVAGVGFTPHVITVNAGEDVASKIMAFSKQGCRTVCILSANGTISNVTLRQASMSGGTVTYEGQFEIICLSGSTSGGGGLSVSLAGSDGMVLGGGVAGLLKAASQVQVVVGSFIADGKKAKYICSGATNTRSSTIRQNSMLNFGSPGGSTESNDDNSQQPINPNSAIIMPTYSTLAWPNAIHMLPN
ncbi:hypothetical protein ACP275_01G118500 [Erythranthe tilingii]